MLSEQIKARALVEAIAGKRGPEDRSMTAEESEKERGGQETNT